MTTNTPIIQAPGGGERLEIAGNLLDVKAAAPELTLVEYDAVGGLAGPPLHVHAFDELFYVLAGRLTVRVGDDVRELEAGGCAFVPGSVPHTFANGSDERVRFLVVCVPGGFESYFRALAAGDAAAVAEASARYGFRTVGELAPT